MYFSLAGGGTLQGGRKESPLRILQGSARESAASMRGEEREKQRNKTKQVDNDDSISESFSHLSENRVVRIWWRLRNAIAHTA